MVLGLLAGGLLRGGQPASQKVRLLFGAGLLGIGVGWALGFLGICPVVKRIWTPSWTLFSAGWASLLLAAFYAVLDARGRRGAPTAETEAKGRKGRRAADQAARFPGWAFPLVVIGMNS